MKRDSSLADAELLLVVVFWALNLTVIKVCLRQMLPLAFNAVRFGLAAAALLGLSRWLEGPLRLAREDRLRVVLLGLLGHTLYQLCFVHGLARTTASSTALLFGSTPVVVALLSRLAGHERIGLPEAGAALLAFYGVSLIVAGGGLLPAPAVGGAVGDLLVIAAVTCWASFTVLSAPLLRRYSPLQVTAYTLTVGTLFLIPPSIPELLRQDWAAVSSGAWAGLLYSCVFALVVSYVLWYRSVRRVGNLRTALYSNLVPVLGAVLGVWLLGERPGGGVVAGGACILTAIVFTRVRAARLDREGSLPA